MYLPGVICNQRCFVFSTAINETDTAGNSFNFSGCSGMQSFVNSNSLKLDETKQKNQTVNPKSSFVANVTQGTSKRLNATPTSYLLHNPMIASPR